MNTERARLRPGPRLRAAPLMVRPAPRLRAPTRYKLSVLTFAERLRLGLEPFDFETMEDEDEILCELQ